MPRGRNHLEADSLLTETRQLLRRYGIHARKRLGQHFLVDRNVLETILVVASLSPNDVVIEVGPGPGILTRELAKRAGRVVAVELDDRLAVALQENLASLHNVLIINGDILKLDPPDLLQDSGGQGEYKVVANLPYYITAPVLRHFLEASPRPQTMVIMVQKEVAETIAANPGRMSLLSISVQFYGRPEIVQTVPAQAFYPAPEVDSAVLRIDIYDRPLVPVTDEKGFFDLVRAGFTASRKQVANSLAQGLKLPKAEALNLLSEVGIAPQRRAETFTLEEWAQLWQVYRRGRRDG